MIQNVIGNYDEYHWQLWQISPVIMTNIICKDEILFVVEAIIGLFLRREQTADKPAGNAAGEDDDDH